jgi:endonuclease/exonuclease/phosphatase family metal-dependent hydrolase
MTTPSWAELQPVAHRWLLVAAALALAACGGGNGGPEDGTAPTDTLRVLAYNIHHGEGMDSVLDLHRIAALIREVDPDLVALQEVDSVTTRTGGVDQAAELGRLTGMEPLYGRFMPYQGGAYGMALLSRWPISQAFNVRLPEGAEPRSAMSVVVTSPKSGRALRFVGIHFYRTEEERLAQAETLDRALAGGDTATILAGDFNSTPGSAVMARLSDSWSVVPKGEDHFTFPSYGPDREIDFVLFRPADVFEVISQRLIDEPVASDHRPVVVDLAWMP